MSSTLRRIAVAPLLLSALACAGGAGTEPDEGVAGTASSTGGAANPTTGGSGGSGGSGSSVPLAGSGQALGGGDQGMFFGPGDVVMILPPEVGGSSAGGGGGGGGPVIPGDGHEMTATMRRGMGGTAIFTQTGEDVTVVFKLTGCADGAHSIAIHDGYACDSATTEGVPWGARGTGIPDIMCSGNQGTLTYTRTGEDKTKNWTVADHVMETDLTAHVLIIASGGDPRAVCANFF
jgi:hypothetical protein